MRLPSFSVSIAFVLVVSDRVRLDLFEWLSVSGYPAAFFFIEDLPQPLQRFVV